MVAVVHFPQYLTHILNITKLTYFYLQVSNSKSGGIWIGVTDSRSENKWTDTNGKALTFKAWSSGEPNNKGNEDCALTNWNGRPVWNDLECGYSHSTVRSYACQYGK